MQSDLGTQATTDDLQTALKDPASLSINSNTADAWSAVEKLGHTAIATSTNDADLTVGVPSGGWLLFNYMYENGGWNDRVTYKVYDASGTELSGGSYEQCNSSRNSWLDYNGNLRVPIVITLPENAAKVTWAITAKSTNFVVYLDDISYVALPGVAVSATGDENTDVAVTSGASEVASVGPGGKATFSATPKTGYVFAGWKTSATSADVVSLSEKYEVTLYDEPLSLYATSSKPFAGSGTEADPFVISTTADLTKLADLVNGGVSFAGQYFKLGDSGIDVAGVEFGGIGTSTNAFAGSFDGDGKTISNIKLTGQGLFNYTKSGAVIKDLTVDGSLVASADNAGMVAGTFAGTMTNVTTKGTISSAKQKVGGIVGNLSGESTVTECSSEVAMTLTYSGYTQPVAGGIVGEASYGTAISKCKFTGSIDGGTVASVIGGILGKPGSGTTVSNCSVNLGSGKTIKGNARVGGIVGSVDAAGLAVQDCTFAGTVEGKENIGGIIGYLNGAWSSSASNPLISNSIASGTVAASEGCAGGIAGYGGQNVGVSGCIALQSSITGTTAKRITVQEKTSLLLSNNYASPDTLVNDAAIDASDATAVANGVNGADLTKISSTIEKTYNGAEQDVSSGTGYTLTAGTVKGTDVGEYTATASLATGCLWDDGTLADKEITWSIKAADLSSATIDAIAAQDYTGTALEPAPTVKYTLNAGETTLAADTDYTVAYARNTLPGTATVTVTGKGNFTGAKTADFTINQTDAYTQDQTAAGAVDEQIAALPATISSSDTAAVESALAAYKALSDGAKAQLDSSTVSTLISAQEQVATIKLNEANAATSVAEQAKTAAEAAAKTAQEDAAAQKEAAETAAAEAQAAKAEAENAATEVKNLKAEVDAQKTAADTAKQQASTLQDELDTQKAATKAAQDKANTQKAAAEKAQGDLDTANSTIAKLQKQIADLTKKPAAKKANTMTAKAKTVKANAKKKTTIKKVKAFTVAKAKGTVTFAKASGNKKITVSKKGVVTVKKGLKKNKTYNVRVKVKAAGNKTYKAKTVTVTLKVKIK